MTHEERQQSLIDARFARDWLLLKAVPELLEPLKSQMRCLIDEFTRLDDKEQGQIRAGKRYGKLGAEHGRKGGRPKKTKNGGKK